MYEGHGRALLAAAILLTSQSPARAADMLTPLRPWVVEYADTQCTASRDYGRRNDPVFFAIRPAPNGETYELLLGRERSGPDYAEEFKGSVDFGHGPINAWLLRYGGKNKGKKADIYSFRISAAEMAAAKPATEVRLRVGGGFEVSLKLNNVSALLTSLGECTKDLMRYWNFNGEATGAIAIPSKGSLRGIFRDSDYPREALTRRQQGTVQFLLLVDEKGTVAGCHIEKASGVPVLDAAGCQVIRERLKLKPARDAQGRPVRSALVTPPVTWRMLY
jgi:TonB family protein